MATPTIKPATAKLNLILNQGADENIGFTAYDEANVLVDLTGYDARLQAREAYDDATPFIDLTVGNGGILIDGPAGTVTTVFSAAVTTPLTVYTGTYDLELVDTLGAIERVVEGSIQITRETTK